MKKIEIVIADDHPQVRTGILKLISKIPGAIVVGQASNGAEAIQLVKELQPDLLLLDLNMPVLNGLEVVKILRAAGEKILILILSAINDPIMILGLKQSGAAGYILKEDAPEKLVPAVCELFVQKMMDVHNNDHQLSGANFKESDSAALIFPYKNRSV